MSCLPEGTGRYTYYHIANPENCIPSHAPTSAPRRRSTSDRCGACWITRFFQGIGWSHRLPEMNPTKKTSYLVEWVYQPKSSKQMGENSRKKNDLLWYTNALWDLHSEDHHGDWTNLRNSKIINNHPSEKWSVNLISNWDGHPNYCWHSKQNAATCSNQMRQIESLHN